MSVLFEKCLTCGASIELSILEKHVTNWAGKFVIILSPTGETRVLETVFKFTCASCQPNSYVVQETTPFFLTRNENDKLQLNFDRENNDLKARDSMKFMGNQTF
ncbi:hypothetical protein OUZ56_021539 [Daphnia magna]|uniref:CpXC domain-containing protein n=1 Tax=Daphnia magna TaxID=35525 RepID=A0ABQ9ZHP3_9CRUS|nr:hypothetical protein OUZ56_021539 [Daphnia magna]